LGGIWCPAPLIYSLPFTDWRGGGGGDGGEGQLEKGEVEEKKKKKIGEGEEGKERKWRHPVSPMEQILVFNANK
jgi:hypothetical protein